MFRKFAETFSVLVLTLVLLIIIFVANNNGTGQRPITAVRLVQAPFLDGHHINILLTALDEIVPRSFDELGSPQDILDCVYLQMEITSEWRALIFKAINEIGTQLAISPDLSDRLDFGANEARIYVDHELIPFVGFMIRRDEDSIRLESWGFTIINFEAFLAQG